MNNSDAYQMGQQIGRVIGVAVVLGMALAMCIFFVLAMVKALTTRRKGWIIAASLSTLPFIAVFILMVIGFAIGFKRGFGHSLEVAAASRGEASPLLTANMTPLTGQAIPYQISLPSADEWSQKTGQRPFDYLFAYQQSAYVGIIAEGIGVKSSEHAVELTQENISKKASDCTFSSAQPIEIDSHSWLTYDASATIHDIQIKYRFYVYADSDYTFQIMAWTVPRLFDHEAPVFDRIAKSFKMPQ